MDPYSQQPTPQNDPLAYLDTIAAPTKTNTINPILLWGGIVGILLALIAGVLLVLSSGGPTKKEQFVTYVYRLQAIQKVSSESSKSIQNSKLRALNASASSILSGSIQESNNHLSRFDLKKLPEEPKTSALITEFTELETKLEDARLNGIYDRVYSRELGYQIAKVKSEIKSLSSSSKNNSFKTYLENTDKNLSPIVTGFNDFNNSES